MNNEQQIINFRQPHLLKCKMLCGRDGQIKNKMSIKEEMKTDYKLISMSDISEEARELAVAWGGDSGMDWIGDKHKLASDIMNYARRSNKELVGALEQLVQLKKWKDKNGKDEHYEKSQPIAWINAKEALAKVGR
jgi:hypothetical protein